MSDSKMFTSNKMPEGYDDVWKRFGQHWCGKAEEPKKIWISKRGKPLAPYREPSTPSNLNRNADYLRRKAFHVAAGNTWDKYARAWKNKDGQLLDKEGKVVS